MKVAPQIKDRRKDLEFVIPSGGPSAPGRRLYFRAAAPVGCDHGTRCRPGSICRWPAAKLFLHAHNYSLFKWCKTHIIICNPADVLCGTICHDSIFAIRSITSSCEKSESETCTSFARITRDGLSASQPRTWTRSPSNARGGGPDQ